MSPTPSLLVAVPKPTRIHRAAKPMRRQNRKRAAARQVEDFGERGAAIRAMPCLIADTHTCGGKMEAAHAKSRGAGGDRRHLVPLCSLAHREQHDRGVATFQTKHGVNLLAEADRIARELDARGLP